MLRARRRLSAFAFAFVVVVLVEPADSFAADSRSALAQRPEVAAALEVFDTWVDWTVRNREQPAVSIGIVYDQELVFARGYGFADVAKKIPATPATAYRIASISKTFTAHAILQLRDAGKLQLDDPITKWIPELKLAKIDPQSPVITIRQLLSHTGGIPREVDGTYWNDMNFPTREAMLPVLNRMGVALPPETEWKYSNVALGLAGYIVEAASGEPYAGVRRPPHPRAARDERHPRDPSPRHADARRGLRTAHGRKAAPSRALLQRELHARRVEPRLHGRGSREVHLASVPPGSGGRRADPQGHDARGDAAQSSGYSRTGRAAGASAGESPGATTRRASATAAPSRATALRSRSRRRTSSRSSL